MLLNILDRRELFTQIFGQIARYLVFANADRLGHIFECVFSNNVVFALAKALDVSEMWLWGYDCPMERPIEQKNNDAISDIIVKMRKDNEFLSVVKTLYNLTPEQMISVKNLLAAFNK